MPEVDATDARLLLALGEDPRASVMALSQRLGLARNTVQSRLARLESNGVLGPLDQRFEIGLLEDDDYSMRARQAGYRLVCAEDAFVHHFGETSFGKLVSSGTYNEDRRHRIGQSSNLQHNQYFDIIEHSH